MFARLSGLVSDLSSVVETKVAPALSHLTNQVTAIIQEERDEFRQQDAEFENKKKADITQVSYALWGVWSEDHSIQEAELKQRILKLAHDIKTFQAVADDSSNEFVLERYVSLCELALLNDSLLATRRYRLVPKRMSESEFWRRYLSHVEDIRREMNLPTLLQHPTKIRELTSKGLLLPHVDPTCSSSANTSSSSSATATQSASSNNSRKESAASLADDMNAALAESEEEYVNVLTVPSSAASSAVPPIDLTSSSSISFSSSSSSSSSVVSTTPVSNSTTLPLNSSVTSASAVSITNPISDAPTAITTSTTTQPSSSSTSSSMTSTTTTVTPALSSSPTPITSPTNTTAATTAQSKPVLGGDDDHELLELEDMLSGIDVTTATSSSSTSVDPEVEALLDEDL